MKDTRPVNLDITTIRFPLAALGSITHRITGVLLFAGVFLLLYFLDLSLSSEEGFARARDFGSSFLARFSLWVVLSAFIFHMIAGIRHLLMDIGIGESKAGGPLGTAIVMVSSGILILGLGVSLLW